MLVHGEEDEVLGPNEVTGKDNFMKDSEGHDMICSYSYQASNGTLVKVRYTYTAGRDGVVVLNPDEVLPAAVKQHHAQCVLCLSTNTETRCN